MPQFEIREHTLASALAPWERDPRKLVSLWEMIKYHASEWFTDAEVIAEMRSPGDAPMIDDDLAKHMLKEINTRCRTIGLRHASTLIDHILDFLEKGYTSCSDDLFKRDIFELRRRILDELKTQLFLYVPYEKAGYYEMTEPFGSKVSEKIPEVITDAEEAGKCFALGRNTACVFHLMRVMEAGVQRLGKKLRIRLVHDKNWQNILDEVNKSVRNMPHRTTRQKMKQAKYGEIAAHLYNVKVAWRNPVMHPKAVYTEGQAREIYDNVRTFMAALAGVL